MRKNILFFIIILIIYILSYSSCASSPKNDGIYCRELNNLTMYLRFFKDGRVISVNIPGKYSDIIHWFNSAYAENTGEYSIEGYKISFTTSAKEGSVEYSGTIGKDNLILNIHSHINGYTQKNIYFRFIPFHYEGD